MALLLGRHICKVDKKGRVSVPKAFRAPFETQEFRGIFVFPLFKYAAIQACSEIQMLSLLQDVNALARFSDDHDDLSAVIMNNAEPITFDSEGRIVIPSQFLSHTNISDNVLFQGQGDRFEMWDPKTFDEYNLAAFERARVRGIILPRASTSQGSVP